MRTRGRKNPLFRPSLALPTLIVLTTLPAHLPGRACWANAAESEGKTLPRAAVGIIECLGPSSYRIGVAPWLSQKAGTFPIATPLEVKTRQSQCRVVLGSESLLESGPSTEFRLSHSATGPLTLSIRSGSALYALAGGSELKIICSPTEIAALAGEENAAPAGKLRPVFASTAHMGIVQVESDGSIVLTNLRGRLIRLDSPNRVRGVAVGQSLRWPERTAESEPSFAPSATAFRMPSPRAAAVPTEPSRTSGGAKAVGSWWVFEPGPAAATGAPDGDLVVLSAESLRWPPIGPPPHVRDRMSPWLPPGRRRGAEPDNLTEPQPPWLPPARGR